MAPYHWGNLASATSIGTNIAFTIVAQLQKKKKKKRKKMHVCMYNLIFQA